MRLLVSGSVNILSIHAKSLSANGFIPATHGFLTFRERQVHSSDFPEAVENVGGSKRFIFLASGLLQNY